MEKLQTLKHYFGHEGFRPLQEEVIDAILNGQDALMVLPTGGGKSLCYQLPTLMMDGVTVVVSPLLALMHDQVTALRANGITAVMLSSMQSHEQIDEIEASLMKGDISFLYVSPERLNNTYFIGLLKKININFFVVDEAHCVSEWGHEFREDYRKLSLLKEEFPSISVAAFTATATSTVERDIASQLQLKRPMRVRGSLFRENMTINAQHRIKDGRAQLMEFLKTHQGEAGIVYTLSRKSTETLAGYLRERGVKARAYHAALPTEEKNQTYTDFVADKVDVVVATIAFGMGIDKSNIRFVVHMSLPKTIENYYQEIGRAGRDGLPAETILLFGAKDIVQQRNFIADLPESAYKTHVLAKLDAMARYAGSETCRHQTIAGYFDDTIEPCNDKCDSCTMPASEKMDISTEAKKLLSGILRTEQRFGLHYVVDVLSGSQDQRLLDNGHDELSVYGIGKDYTRAQWLTIGDRLLEIGAVQIGEYNVYALTPKGVEIIKGSKPVELKKDRLVVKKTKVAKPITDLSDQEAAVFEKLRILRKDIAEANHIPPYVVFSDKTLKEFSTRVPKTELEMLDINGVGAVKFERYGEEFLYLLSQADVAEQARHQ
jgi:ATP-dependent DNA helicase RecQ